MDAKKTIEKLRGEADRKRISLYLSESIYEEFRQSCGEVSPSKVIEELMKEFVEDLKVKRPGKKVKKS
jgi:DNA-binding MarR family transcriptional regulator